MPDTRTVKVLIVEDEAITALSIRAALEDLGYEVVGPAMTSAEALSLAHAEAPDLVLMDIHLQGGTDGIETALAMRGQTGTPVVFLTAWSDEATLARARAAEPYGYILKPFDLRSLGPAIEMAVHKHGMEMERKALLERLQAALAEVEQLQGLLPLCAWCKRVRDDEGYWADLEEYLAKRLHATYTHGICPECFARAAGGDDEEA